MTHLLIQAIEKKFINKKMPVLRSGYQVRVHQKIKEGEKERIQIFEGMVIKGSAGHGSSKTVTVRKVVEGIGVEKVFAINSPLIAKIEIKKTFKVRRANLSYLKKAEGLSKRLSAKLGLTEKDEAHRKKREVAEETVPEAVEEAAEAPTETVEAAAEAPVEAEAVVETEVEAPVEAEAPAEEAAPAPEEKAEETAEAPKQEEAKEEPKEEQNTKA